MTTPRPWARAARWLAFLGPFFFLSYGATTWITTQHASVGAVVFDWERNIPFIPWTIIPYWSIDVLYGLSLFLCATQRELDTHARRLLTAQIIAVSCFLLFPLTFTFPRPAVEGVAGFLFDALGKFDKPFNQAPSLHIALLVILWDRYARHAPYWARGGLHAWFALIGVSVLTTYQHHFVDVPTGALLGFFCLWLWPEQGPSPLRTMRITTDPARVRLAVRYAAGAALCAALAAWMGGGALWLLWPAVSLVLVAAHYALFGAAGFQKAADGRMSLAARALLAPYIMGAWINSRLWTRNDPLTVLIAPPVSLGRFPSRATASAFVTIIDLCAELPGASGAVAYRALPMLDLITPPPEQLRQAVALIETACDSGPVLVCCALGYGRSAACVTAWLLATGRAADMEAAMRVVRAARPRAVLKDTTRAAIAAAAISR